MAQLTAEELQQFRGFRRESNRLAAILGELSYQETLLQAEIDNLKQVIKENVKNQQAQLKALGEKYGDGTIDVETGEITTVSAQ